MAYGSFSLATPSGPEGRNEASSPAERQAAAAVKSWRAAVPLFALGVFAVTAATLFTGGPSPTGHNSAALAAHSAAALSNNASALAGVPEGAEALPVHQFKVNLMKNEHVAKFIGDNSLDATDLLPFEISIAANESLLRGSVGPTAAGGYVAFCLAYGKYRGNQINASYVVVADMLGNVVNVRVGDAIDIDGERYVTRFEALKPYNDTTLILARKELGTGTTAVDTDLNHSLVLWNWKEDTESVWFAEEDFTMGSHDVQLNSETGEAFVLGTTAGDDIHGLDANGEQTWYFQWNEACVASTKLTDEQKMKWCNQTAHFNHMQLESTGEAIYASARDLNSIFKINSTSGDLIWVLGGALSDFKQKTTGDASVFFGQHNAEVKEDGTVIMFDNGYDYDSNTFKHNSRFLSLTYDESDFTFEVEWHNDLGVRAHVFGDADKLPTGNVIGTAWTSHVVSNDPVLKFDCFVQEATREKEIAWQLNVLSYKSAAGMDYTNTESEAPAGWAMYAVERFFDRPIVVDLTVSDDELSFTTWNSHRNPTREDGTARVGCPAAGTVGSETTFKFNAMWAKTEVTLTLDDDLACPDGQFQLLVSNIYGTEATVDFNGEALSA